MKSPALSWHVATAFCFTLGAACMPGASNTQQDSNSGGSRSSGGSGGGVGTSSGGSGGSSSGGSGGSSSSGGSLASGGESGAGGSGSGGVAASGGETARGGAGGSAGAGGSSGGAGGNTTAEGGRPGSGGRAGAGGTETTGGAGGQAGNGDAGTGQVTLSGLKIEANSKNVLSCFVSWKTDQPASSDVQFGVGKYEWEISDQSLVTDHKVLVIGMHASQTYQIKARSSSSSGSGSAEGEFTTGALPASIPVAEVSVVDKAKMQPGWTLMNVQMGDGTATYRSKTPNQAVMYDEAGQPVWYYINGTTESRGGMVSVDLTDKGVLIGAVMNDAGATAVSPKEIDFAGNTLWQCGDPLCGGTGTLTHHVGKLSNGHYIIQRDVTTGGNTGPVFEEHTADNQVVWSWDYAKFVQPPAGAMGDWCHGNSVTVDIDKDVVYANCRWMGLVKTSYKNPVFQWHLPAAYGGKGTGNMTFSPTTSQYSDTHDPEIHDDGTIIFFDNGGWDGMIGEDSNPNGYHSRVVEYKIDEAAKTATLVWEFPGSFNVDAWYKDSFYIPSWGDADRLANGNVLITAGVRYTKVQSRVFEVTKQDGKVVWEFKLPVKFGMYRSERLSPPPLVRAIQ